MLKRPIVDIGLTTLDRAADRESELLIERWGRLISPCGDIDRDRPVLVVEDDEDVREMLRIGLKSDGFETMGAADGREALRMANRTPPQAILLDLELPRLSGRGFIEKWRGTSSAVADAVPVVVVSGSRDAAAIAEAIGADAMVQKPVDLDKLSALLHRLTEAPNAANGQR